MQGLHGCRGRECLAAHQTVPFQRNCLVCSKAGPLLPLWSMWLQGGVSCCMLAVPLTRNCPAYGKAMPGQSTLEGAPCCAPGSSFEWELPGVWQGAPYPCSHMSLVKRNCLAHSKVCPPSCLGCKWQAGQFLRIFGGLGR